MSDYYTIVCLCRCMSSFIACTLYDQKQNYFIIYLRICRVQRRLTQRGFGEPANKHFNGLTSRLDGFAFGTKLPTACQ